jgi:molybdopterin-containing oxidoreductase family iron-sulfur binding subunit
MKEKDRLPVREDVAGIPVRDEVRTPPGELSRRTVMKLMAASAALAVGGPGCKRKPYRKIVSMADSPEYQHPGEELYYASTWTEGQVPYGMMVKVVDGRPVKIEGLPGHPLNQGTSSAQMQSSILSLYDPNRAKKPVIEGIETAWEEVDRTIVDRLKTAKSVMLVTRSSLGPSERSLVKRFLEACPTARHCVHESVHDGMRREAWRRIYGADGEVRPVLSKAKIILSIDSDFLGTDGAVLETTRDFAGTRAPEAMSRLYVVESAMTVTGSNADHRIPLKPSQMLDLVQALRKAVKGDRSALSGLGMDEKLLAALADDLKNHQGRAVVLAGSHLPVPVHAAVCLLNADLSAQGNTLEWNPTPATLPVSKPEALKEEVDVLITFGTPFKGRGKYTVHHGHYESTATVTLPSSHNLESWNDAAPLPGLITLCQPMIAPIYDTRQEAESLLAWTKALVPENEGLAACKDWHDYIRLHWKNKVLSKASDFDGAWDDALRSGMSGKKASSTFLEMDREAVERLTRWNKPETGDLELVVTPHHGVFDGRFEHSAWLMEFPDPVSKLVWDRAVSTGPKTARRLGLVEGDVVNVSGLGELPVLVQPGVADGVLAATYEKPLGDSSPWLDYRASVTSTGRKHELVRIQKYFDMQGRPIVLDGTKAQYEKDPHFVRGKQHVPPLKQIDDAWDYSQGHKWAMAVDLSRCTGCGHCMIACQAENNIPTVGKEECGRGREMSWIRIDRYHGGDEDNPVVYQQPMFCQHCDNAPCESVCPVNATSHSHEGLNEQTYNRCVGTRYCANNCPYKVRRFNFFNYTKEQLSDPVQELHYNPNVTVRSRGVMEKCTFCLQRINAVKFKAKNEKKPIPDGAIRPACAQACPAGALVFGDVNDPKSRIAKLRKASLAYLVLEELNVRPNVTYLARIRNPHPEIMGPDDDGGHG